jgi:hypothetical protein
LEKDACGAFSDGSFVAAVKRRGFCRLPARQILRGCDRTRSATSDFNALAALGERTNGD